MWQDSGKELYKEFEFKDFKQAFTFMEKVAKVAEEQSHHPKWTNEYNKVEVWLNTHEADDQITDKDRTLAKAIDRLNQS